MRTVPANTVPLILLQTVRCIHAFILTINGTPFYFAEAEFHDIGHDYLPYLDINTGTRYTLSLSDGSSCKITLDNVDLATAALLQANRDNLQGSPAQLIAIYLESGEFVTLLRGTVTDCVTDDNRATMTISGFDPNTIQLPTRIYSQRCTWKYKGPGCPSTSVLTTCDKLFSSCVTRIATQGFNGVITISDTLSSVVQGATGPIAGGGSPIGGGGDGLPDPRLLLPSLP